VAERQLFSRDLDQQTRADQLFDGRQKIGFVETN